MTMNLLEQLEEALNKVESGTTIDQKELHDLKYQLACEIQMQPIVDFLHETDKDKDHAEADDNISRFAALDWTISLGEHSIRLDNDADTYTIMTNALDEIRQLFECEL